MQRGAIYHEFPKTKVAFALISPSRVESGSVNRTADQIDPHTLCALDLKVSAPAPMRGEGIEWSWRWKRGHTLLWIHWGFHRAFLDACEDFFMTSFDGHLREKLLACRLRAQELLH